MTFHERLTRAAVSKPRPPLQELTYVKILPRQFTNGLRNTFCNVYTIYSLIKLFYL